MSHMPHTPHMPPVVFVAIEGAERQREGDDDDGVGETRFVGSARKSTVIDFPSEAPPVKKNVIAIRAMWTCGALLLVAAIAVGAVAIVGLTAADRDPDYRAWKERYDIEYETRAENQRRYALYVAYRDEVARLNSVPGAIATFEVNKFAAYDDKERESLRGLTPLPERPHSDTPHRSLLQASTLPASIDWTQNMAPVADQGAAGYDARSLAHDMQTC